MLVEPAAERVGCHGAASERPFDGTAREHRRVLQRADREDDTAAASQSDATDTIRQHAKDVGTSTASIKAVITRVDNDALQLLADPTNTNLIPEIVSLSDHAYHGFDQNGNGTIEPVVGKLVR